MATAFKQPGGFEPFHATRVWNEIVTELKRRVPNAVNCQKYGSGERKVFRGADAVQTLSSYLAENRGALGIKEVNENKVLKLCQILVKDHIIERVKVGGTTSTASGPMSGFDGTNNALYRFGEKGDQLMRPMYLSPVTRGAPKATTEFYNQRKCMTPNAYARVFKQPNGEPKTVGCEAFEGYKFFPNAEMTHAASCSSMSSVDSSASGRHRHHSNTVDTVDDLDPYIVHDVALFKLLTLVEVPVLDGILFTKDDADFGAAEHSSSSRLFNKSYSKLLNFSAKKKSHKNCREIPSAMFEYDGEIVCSLRTFSDPWLHASAFCLEELEISLLSELDRKPTVIEQRLLMFHKVVEHFKRFTKDQPIVPERYEEIVRQMTEILMIGNTDKVLTSCKLLLLLLPTDRRRRLAALLRFVDLVVNDCENLLSDQMSNIDFVLTNFKEVVFRCRIVPAQRLLQLLKFLVVNCHQVLTCPSGFRDEVISRQNNSPSKELPPGNKSSVTFCEQISAEEFDRQNLEASEKALMKLVGDVIDNTNLLLEEKIAWLERFKAEYPRLYEKHFKDITW